MKKKLKNLNIKISKFGSEEQNFDVFYASFVQI
jgi:hypothetical protein